MIKRIVVFLFFSGMLLNSKAQKLSQAVTLKAGMKITTSQTIIKKTYALAAPTSQAVIVIEGNDITIDFKDAVLQGSTIPDRPDQFKGTALMIRNSKRVTIKNLHAKGYKIGILAENVKQLVIENCDLSYNYRARLGSTREREDTTDWLSYHHNENDEWMRYGAGIYLSHCDSATVRNCLITGGQNGLLMTSCNTSLVYNNDFSFNSGVGIGLYRSSRNNISNNRLVFNVRGYSHGVYNRGQDSAAILVYEQSSDNIFYHNNATHSGDGFFLWAGQSTMDNGKGGSNNNIIAENDFSYAPTNGIEATFSQNTFVSNRVFECDYGFWGGYSYNTALLQNQFRNNRIGLAIEHGQFNKIAFNIFFRNKTAIKLWAPTIMDTSWGYPKFRDTRSHHVVIVSNSFSGSDVAVNLSSTDTVSIFSNTYTAVEEELAGDGTVNAVDTNYLEGISDELAVLPEFTKLELGKNMDPFRNRNQLAGRKNIRMTEWGPYDYRYPLLWRNEATEENDTITWTVLGPPGKWKMKSFRGVTQPSAMSGTVGATISARRGAGPIRLEMEYVGEAVRTNFGQPLKSGSRINFSY